MKLLPSKFAAAALLSATPLFGSQSGEPEAGGAAFLLLPVGARAAGLGQAAVADGGTGESAFWNPAGLALIDAHEFAVHHSSTFASDNTALSAHFNANGLGVFGASAYLVDFGSQDLVTGPGAPVGRISPKNVELLGSFATTVASNLLVGINYKLIQFRQDCSGDCTRVPSVVGTTHGVDMGMQYAVGPMKELRLGVVVRHAGFRLQLENEGQADPLPTRVQVGAIYTLTLPARPGSLEALDARVLVDLDDAWGEYDSPDARVGLELGYGDLVRIRSGYAFLNSESSGPSVGFGLRIGRVAVDFARAFFDSSSFDEPLHISLRAIL